MKKPALLFLSFIPAVDESNSAPENSCSSLIASQNWLVELVLLQNWKKLHVTRKIEIA